MVSALSRGRPNTHTAAGPAWLPRGNWPCQRSLAQGLGECTTGRWSSLAVGLRPAVAGEVGTLWVAAGAVDAFASREVSCIALRRGFRSLGRGRVAEARGLPGSGRPRGCGRLSTLVWEVQVRVPSATLSRWPAWQVNGDEKVAWGWGRQWWRRSALYWGMACAPLMPLFNS